MSAKPTTPLRFDPSTVDDLACPACRGCLHLEGSRLICDSCRRAYPVVDGIPALIAERAEAVPERDAADS
jgi:uncharacterized protein